jgi:hypothetical protein
MRQPQQLGLIVFDDQVIGGQRREIGQEERRRARNGKKRSQALCAGLLTGSDHGGRSFAANKDEALCLVKW